MIAGRALGSDRAVGKHGWYVIGAASALYLVVASHTVIGVDPGLPHDDGLFIKRALNILDGSWMGSYDAFALAKGPGYPLFLVVAFVAGLPVTVSHALLHGAASLSATLSLGRLTRVTWLAAAVYVALLWHPAMLPLRVTRDSVYGPEIVLVAAALLTITIDCVCGRQRAVASFGAGVLFGWFWLTREEGLWALPGLASLLLGAGWIVARQADSAKPLITAIAAFAAAWLTTVAIYSSVNRMVYGKFVGVDVVEGNFKRAVADLQSVRVGEVVPYVPVPRKVREQIYAVSPAFAELKWFLEDERSPGHGWLSWGCGEWFGSCGDLAAGGFLWALRDAVASRGYYESPAKASSFYRRLAREIEAACARRDLDCKRSFIALMPQTTLGQLRAVPRKIMRAIAVLMLVTDPPPIAPADLGPASIVPKDVDLLLGRPFRREGVTERELRLTGWYYASGSAWFSLECKAHGDLKMRVMRTSSADVARAFDDPAADEQRYELVFNAVDCPLSLVDDSGRHDFDLDAVLHGQKELSFGQARFHVDSYVAVAPPLANGLVARIQVLRARLVSIYRGMLPVLGFAGVFAYVGAVAFVVGRKAPIGLSLVFATAMAILVAARILVVVMVEISSFAAVESLYLTPAYPLFCLFAFSSLIALFEGRAP